MRSKTKDNVKAYMFSDDGLEFATSHPYTLLNTLHRGGSLYLIMQWCKERDIEIEYIGFASGGRAGDRYYFQHWKCNSKEDSLKVILAWG